MQTEATDAWDETAVLENVRRVVHVLMTVRGVDVGQLADVLGLKRGATYNRLQFGGRVRFSVAEIYRMARVFDVPASVFFEPVEDLLGGLTGGFRKAPFLFGLPAAA